MIDDEADLRRRVAELNGTIESVERSRERDSAPSVLVESPAERHRRIEHLKRQLRTILSRPAVGDFGEAEARKQAQTLYDQLCLHSGEPAAPEKRPPHLKVISNDDPPPPEAA